MTAHARLIALQPTDELRRKAVKSSRRGYGKEGSFRLATDEIYEFNARTTQNMPLMTLRECVSIVYPGLRK